MTFGLRKAAQTFQRFIDEALAGLDFCFAYIDDIFVFSPIEEQYRIHLDKLFQRLSEYGVIINPGKWVFRQDKIEFLGYEITANGTTPLPEKIEAIRSYSKPRSVKDLRRFLVIINFYRSFIPKGAQVQALLNDLAGNVKGKPPIK